jgi:hypothetical protein
VLESRVRTLYFRELTGAVVLYAVVLAIALLAGQAMSPGWGRTLVMVSPMAPSLLTVWVVARQIGRVDEFVRLSTLQGIAVAAAVTAGWTFTYGFLENAGFPRLSMFTIWPVMGAVWGLTACVQAWRASRGESERDS